MLGAFVTATYSLATNILGVDIVVEDAQGPFRPVLSVSELTTELALTREGLKRDEKHLVLVLIKSTRS